MVFFMFHHCVTSRTSKCDISLSLGEKITASCFLGVLIRKVPQIYEIRFFYAGHFTPKKDETVMFSSWNILGGYEWLRVILGS